MEFVIAENCPNCPRCLEKNETKKGGSNKQCYDSELKQDTAERALEKEFDQAFAALNYEYYRLAGFDIRGVLTMSRFAKDSYVENPFITPDSFKRKQLPAYKSCYHPARNNRKLKKLLDMISGLTPIRNTHPSSSKAGGSKRGKGTTSISRREESMLAYKLLEPYFEALIALTGCNVSLDVLFGILEASDTYRPMFSLQYATLRREERYKSMSLDVQVLINNPVSVAIAKSKVLLSLFILACPKENRYQRRGLQCTSSLYCTCKRITNARTAGTRPIQN
jgi:hypothetical protein